MTRDNFRWRALPLTLVLWTIGACLAPDVQTNSTLDTPLQWESVETENTPIARHEASLVAFKDTLLLIGGRGLKPVDEYRVHENKWVQKSFPPIELHHFQAVTIGDTVYIVGAMTGPWPIETPVDRVIAYYPKEDRFEYLHDIPEPRRRGSAGAVVHDGKIYLVGGITNGHMDGTKAWLDEYDPKTGAWRVLPDAPHARDHFQLAVQDEKLYAFAGRRSRQRTSQGFELTVRFGDVFDLRTNEWRTVSNSSEIPVQRAGNMAIAVNDEIVIGGGESSAQVAAHGEVEAYNTQSRTWREWPRLNRGRHGTGFARIGEYIYTASGSGNRGGEPELTSLERLKVQRSAPVRAVTEHRPVHQQWHTLTLSFEGPTTSETANPNPFTDYRLLVDFVHPKSSYTVRGFYAADGNAAETSADAGNVWQVRFTPDELGEWTYSARLQQGEGIAIAADLDDGTRLDLKDASGAFYVQPSDKDGVDFRANGRLTVEKGYFKFAQSDRHWLKGGTNSPENLLGYADFDGTYRINDETRDGEATAGENLHRFEPHIDDWQLGDPSWQDGKGKGLIGALNYLASEGMNSAYFLTLNILGDGQDVWPYRSPDDVSRFDVSKLDQWEIVFSHMQQKGILLHIVTQETENELMLDGGETGSERKLYFQELVARFGHHPGLIWNLGEENGPVHWRPEGQNTQQRIDMATYLKAVDPYQNPVVLHTHSEAHDKDEILTPLLGVSALDGLSFQVSERETVNAEVQKWMRLSRDAGSPWLITMDEIGKWDIGAKPDALDPTHDTLRRHALWGTLLAGGAGVEWYFGAHQPGNDLTSEDWRMRQNLWRQTRHAMTFFETHLEYWNMQPCEVAHVYCLSAPAQRYVVYLPDQNNIDLTGLVAPGDYAVQWFDPIAGGALQTGSHPQTQGGTDLEIGKPPAPSGDWVLLLDARPPTSNDGSE
ncbi:MAG: DUF5060 domain-containing protein [Pseudomonadota bacterium]